MDRACARAHLRQGDATGRLPWVEGGRVVRVVIHMTGSGISAGRPRCRKIRWITLACSIRGNIWVSLRPIENGCYSARSATSGSTDVARFAGTNEATRQTMTSRHATAA